MKRLRNIIFLGSIGAMLFLHDAPLPADTNEVFLQTDWSGGASVLNAIHPDNKTSWTRFSSKDIYLNTGVAGRVTELVQVASVTDTTDADFTGGVLTKVDISGTGTAASVVLQAANDDPFGTALGQWTTMPELPALVQWSPYVRAGSYIYSLWRGTALGRFNITTEKWDFLADIPMPISHGAALAYGGGDFIYATRGGGTKHFYRYSISANTWTRLADVPYGVGYGGTMASNNADRIYCLVGGGTNRFYMYTISTNTWTTLPVATRTVNRGASLVYPGSGTNLYAVFDTTATNFSRYSMAGDQWVALTAAPVAVGDLCYPGTGNYLYGWYEETWGNNFARYNLSTQAWENLSVTSPFPIYQYRGIFYDPGTDGKLRWLTMGNYGRTFAFDPLTTTWDPEILGVKGNSISNWGDMFHDGADYIYHTTGGGNSGFARYSISANKWASMANMPWGVYYGHEMALVDGGIYVIQGYSNTGFARYDPGTNTWTALAVTPAYINYGGSLASDGTYIYCLRGTGTVTFWRYDRVAGTWAGVTEGATTDTPAAINGGSLVYPYAPGGGDFLFTPQGYNTKTFYKYEISTKTWTQVADAPYPFSSNDKNKLTYPGSGNYIYAFFGAISGYGFARYDFVNNTWETLAPSPLWQDNVFVGVAAGDKVYATNSVDMITYTISTNTWESSRKYDVPAFTYGSLINPETDLDTVYMVYGNSSSVFYKYSVSQRKVVGLIKAPFLFLAGAKAAYPGSGNFIYMVSGGLKKALWRYDFVNDSWAQLADAPNPVFSGAKFTGKGDVLYLAPGRDITNLTSQNNYAFLKYTISTNTWESVINLPYPIQNSVELGNSMIHIPAQGRIYWRPGSGSGSFYVYNTGADVWTSLASLPVGGYSGQALYYPGTGDFIYNVNEQSARFYRYSISANTWTELARPSRGWGYYSNDAAMFYPGSGDVLYFFDGTIGYFARYSLSNNAWDQPPALPTSTVLQYYSLFEGGGPDGDTFYSGGYSSFYKYSLTSQAWTSLRAPASDIGWNWDEWTAQLHYPGTGDFLYATRGRNRTNFARYSVSQNKWFSLASPTFNFGYGHKMAGAGSHIYMLRGDSTRQFWSYNIINDQWSSLADLPATVSYGSSLRYPGFGDFIYATRGDGSSDFYKYSIANNTWTQLTNVPVVLFASDANGAALVYPGRGDHLYFLPGPTYGYYSSFAGFFRYSITQNTWEEIAPAPAGIMGNYMKIVYPGKGDYLYAARGAYSWDILKFHLFKQGEYTSPIKNIGLNQTYDTVTWNNNGQGTVEFKVRTSNDAQLADAPAWESVPQRLNGDNMADSYPAVKPNDQYLQYQMKFFADNIAQLPALNDLTIRFDKYPRQQELISSAYNSTEARNRLMKLTWNNTLPVGTSTRFLLRTAPDNGGQPGTWTPWLGPGGTQTIHNTFSAEADYAHGPSIEVIDDLGRLKKVLQDFLYTQRIVLDNTTGVDYSNIIQAIEIDETNNHFWTHVKPDGSDVRFVDWRGNVLSYNMSANGGAFDYASKYAKVYISIAALPAGEKNSIYLKYGNPDAVDASQPGLIGLPGQANLVAWYAFDETNGTTAIDSSGRGNHGVLQNNPVWVVGKHNNALSFNGSNQYVDIGANASLKFPMPFTFGMWVKLPVNIDSNWRHLISSAAWSGNPGYDTMMNANQNLIMSVNGNETTTPRPSFAIPTGEWHHIVYAVSSTTSKIYIDGALRQTWNGGWTLGASPYNTWIGYSPAGGYNYFWGSMDDVVIYNRDLSDTEVSQLYQASGSSAVPYYFSTVEVSSTSPSLSGWTFRDQIEIDNTDGGALADYQIQVALTPGFEGFWENCLASGADVRFVDSDNVTVLDHYTLTFDHANKTASFWVKVPVIMAGELKRIYLYYGRPDAADVSSMAATMTKDFQEKGTENLSGLSVDGLGAKAEVAPSAALDVTGQVTVEANLKYGIDYWPAGWAYRKTVTLDNSAGGVIDGIIQFDVPFAAGMNADYSDLRFWETDHTRKLRYRIVSSDAAKATVMVEVPEVEAQTTKDIYLYYGNTGAASESIPSLALLPSSGLTGYWKFDEGSGTSVADSSPSGYTGTFISLPLWVDGKSGKALRMDNVDDGVNITGTNLAGTADFTMAAWVYILGNHRNYTGTIMSSGNWNYTFWAFGLAQNNTQIQFLRPSVSYYYSFDVNNWYHIAVVRSGVNFIFYVNGNRLGTAVGTETLLETDASNMTIGRETYASGYFSLNGIVEEPIIYNRALTDAEIQAVSIVCNIVNMPATFGPAETEPSVMRWLPGFSYRRKMTIDNTGLPLTRNSAYSWNIDLEPGKMKSDFADVRFVDTDGKNLVYNIYSFDEAQANILVRVPVVPADSTKDIFMYYGNAQAVAENDTTLVPMQNFSYPSYEGWVDNAGTPPRTFLGSGYGMMEGYGNGGSGTYVQYSLPLFAAGTYNISADIYLLDSWDSEYVQLFVNGVLAWQQHRDVLRSEGTFLGNVTGSNASYATDYKWTGTIPITHVGGDLTLRFTTTLNEGSTNESFGLDNVTIPGAAPITPAMGSEETAPSGIDQAIALKEGAYGLKFTDAGLTAVLNGTSLSTTSYDSGRFMHAAMTYNGTALKLFVNGIEKASSTVAGEINTNSNPLVIGDGMNGVVDEVRVWDLARLEGSIDVDQLRYIDGDEQGLVSYLRFNDAAGLAAVDASIYGNNAVLSGGAGWALAPFAYINNEPRVIYHMDEGMGSTVSDATGHGNTLTLSNTNWSSVDLTGFSTGRSLNFNGTTFYGTASASSSLDVTDRVTLEAWIKPLTNAGNHTILNKGSDTGLRSNYALVQIGDSVAFRFFNGVSHQHLVTPACLTIGNIYYIAATFDVATDTVNIYVNGMLRYTNSVEYGRMLVNADPLYVGREASGTNPFTGTIDEVRVYNRVLTQDEITGHYEQRLWSPVPPVIYNVYDPLTSVDVGAYAVDNPVIQPVRGFYYGAANMIEFQELSNKPYGTDIRYQISPNAYAWYWWDGVEWSMISGGYSQTNTADEINSHFAAFQGLFPDGVFYYRAYLHSEPSSFMTPSLDDVGVTFQTGETYYVLKDGGDHINPVHSDATDDQWFQYKAILYSDGMDTPVINDVNVEYINAYVQVTSPNGGDVLAVGSTVPITWAAQAILKEGGTGTVKIEYSVDGGNIYQTIAEGVANTGTFDWTIPDTPSQQALVRITSQDLPVVMDVSDTLFRILSVTLTSPNGGEVWESAKTHAITWNATGAVPNNIVKIEYSSNGGSTWTVISAVAPNTGTYSWTVPPVFSDSMQVRISSPSNDRIVDMSDAVFSVVRVPAFTISSPVEGAAFSVGAPAEISWRTNSLVFAQDVVLEYSTDDFQADIQTIATVGIGTPQGTNNNDNIIGTYNWTVPDIISSSVKVRVREASIPPGRDTQQEIAIVSPAFSIIQPQVIITAPGAAETWVAGDTENIVWSSQGTVSDDLKFEYSVNGTDFVLIADHQANTGTYAWAIPAGAVGNAVYIRITDNGRPQVVSVTEPFRVLAHTAIEMIQPDGGETLTMGTDYEIRWRSYGNKLESGGADYNKISIFYSLDNGATWTLIAFDRPNIGSYTWRVPDFETTQGLVRVVDQDDPLVVADSAAVFEIVLPTITLTSPVGGESWYATGSYQVTWTSVGSISNNLRLEYSTDSGSTWNGFKTGQPNTGTYTWGPVADVDSTQVRVRITDMAHPTVMSVSPADFTIMPPTLTLISPNGGEVYAVGTTHNMRWATTGELNGAVRDNLTMQFSSNGGAAWTNITTGEANDGIYEWTVPDNVSATCLIRVFDATRPATSDTSDAVFAVVLPSVTITAPNGGEEWPIGTDKQITWTSIGAVSNNLRIEYSRDNFATATVIASGVNNVEAYAWTVPDDLAPAVKVRITDMSRPEIVDVSDNTFSIINPVLTLTYPNGGELVSVDDVVDITWMNEGTITNSLKIEYSTDGFITTHEIAASAPHTGSYSWTVPDDVSASVKVQITDNGRPVVWDKSDQNFTILPTPVITLTAPSAESVWRIGTVHDITWTDNGGRISNNLTLEYSTDGGSVWKPIATGVPNTGAYAWTVPDDLCPTAIVRIFDAQRPATIAVSVPFVLANPLITLVAPNGGEKWAVGDRGPVRWTTEGTVSDNLTLEYSPDAGTTWYLVRGGIPNTGSYSWTIPDYVTVQCLLRIKDNNRPAVTDVSDAVFTIDPLPTITVLSPSGGEEYVLGDDVNITWEWTGLAIANITIDYSNDNFITRRIIATGVPNTGSYTWTIPPDAMTGQGFQIRLTDGTRTQIMDKSEGFFRIRGGFRIISPNGGEQWVAKSPQNITWQTMGTLPNVRLEYTVDGMNWIFIASPSNIGSYTWTLPDVQTTTLKVRISDPNDPTTQDVSDATFSSIYATVVFKVLDYDSLQHLQDFSVSEPATGWSDSGQLSPITRTAAYSYGSYTTFFSKPEYIDASVSWSPPKSGSSPYNITVYIENSSNALVSWEAILTYSFSPATDTLSAIASLQRKGKLVGTTEVERADLGPATLTIYESDGETVRNALTATTPSITGMYNFTLQDTGFEGGRVYPAVLSIEYRGNMYVSSANIDVGSEILQYEFFTQTATNLAASVENIERTVNSTATDIKTEVKSAIEATHTDLKADTTSIKTATETVIPAKLDDIQDTAETMQRSEILNTESNLKMGDKLVIRYRTFSGLHPVIDVYNAENIQEINHGAMTEVGTTGIYEYLVHFTQAWGKGEFTVVCSEPTRGSMDALTLTVGITDIEQVYNQVSAVIGQTASLSSINAVISNIGTQFTAIEGVLNGMVENISSDVRDAMGSGTTLKTLYAQLTGVSRQIREIGGDKGINLERLYEVSADRQQDMVYLKNKTQELKATMDLSRKLMENIANKPVTQTWFEYKK